MMVGLLYYLGRHRLRQDERLDDAVELTSVDYEGSEFRRAPKQLLLGAAVAVCALGLGFQLWGTTPINIIVGFCSLGGLSLYGLYIREDRIVFRDRKILSLRGEKLLWRMEIADIDEITPVYLTNGAVIRVRLKPVSGEDRIVYFGAYENPRKLKLMLLRSKRSFEDG